MAKQTINSGTAPILWSTVNEAFQAINDNFTELYLTVSGGPGAVVDLTDLGSSLIPRSTEFYDLGSNSKRWRDLYLSGSSLYLGDAVITSTGTGVNLPFGSTIGGATLDQEYFKEIAVAGQSNIVADPGGSDTLTIAAGNLGITLTTDAGTDTLTISNSGVTSLTTNTGLSTNVSATGGVTVTNTGVIGFSNTTVLPDARTPGTGITVSATSGSGINITNTGVLQVTTFGGSGITINNPSPGVYEFVNSSPNINQNVFRDVAVSGQSTLVADSAQDTLTFANGTGIDITTTELTDTITITNTGVTTLGGGTGISVSAATGSVTVSNTGVTSIIAGSGINISAGTGAVTISSTGNGFANFAVSGNPTPIQADNAADTFVFVAGEGVVLIPNPVNDSLEINVAYLVGNVYGDNSSLLVDAVGAQIVGDINTGRLRTTELSIALGDDAGAVNQANGAVAVGEYAGNTNQSSQATAVGQYAAQLNQGTGATALGTSAGSDDQGARAVAVGSNAGQTTQGSQSIGIGWRGGNYQQGTNSIAIGTEAGESNQGNDAIAIGRRAGYSGQSANSIVINASGTALMGTAAGFYVDPVRNQAGPGNILQYDTTTKEIYYSTELEGNFTGSVFADDSTKIIDAVENRVYTTSIETSVYMQTGVYANDTARDAAITAPAAGMIVFNQTGNKFQGYTGSGWIDLN